MPCMKEARVRIPQSPSARKLATTHEGGVTGSTPVTATNKLAGKPQEAEQI
jgi:hypothetical protein